MTITAGLMRKTKNFSHMKRCPALDFMAQVTALPGLPLLSGFSLAKFFDGLCILTLYPHVVRPTIHRTAEYEGMGVHSEVPLNVPEG